MALHAAHVSCARRVHHYSSVVHRCQRKHRSRHQPAGAPLQTVTDMIKTFSLSALFFLTLGLLAALHTQLPLLG